MGMQYCRIFSENYGFPGFPRWYDYCFGMGEEVAMPIVETPFGPIEALPRVEYHPSGAVRSCIAAAPSPLRAPCGELVPQYRSIALRKRRLPAISFHENGMPRTLPLEEQTPVDTPLGTLPAEQVTFHDCGAVHRVFPLNGCLSGYWSQEDEGRLASPLEVRSPAGPVAASLVAVRFARDGALLGLTLWPGEVADVACPCGTLPVRVGVAFAPDGSVRSVEPARPMAVHTPLGEVLAFDPDAVGVTGDVNSLGFDETGAVARFSTVSNAFDIARPGADDLCIEPPMRVNPCDGETREPGPLHVRIEGGVATFHRDGAPPVSAPLGRISVRRFARPLPILSPACGMNASFM